MKLFKSENYQFQLYSFCCIMDIMRSSKPNGRINNVGIITFPIARRGNVPLSQMVDIFDSIFDNIYIITGNYGEIPPKDRKDKLHLFAIKHRSGQNLFSRILNYIKTQIKISYKLAILSKKVDVWVFFFGECLILPAFTAKLARKKYMLVITGSVANVATTEKDPFAKTLNLLQNISYHLAPKLILYSEKLIAEYNLQKYQQKIVIARHHFLDFNKFTIRTEFNKRGNLVGYFGALSYAKGVWNFIQAISILKDYQDNLNFLLGGEGELSDKINYHIDNTNMQHRIKAIGWVPHDKLPDYLNQLKLLVLPSYSEGLPNILVEAMACGTPVLATSIGAIPDLIHDGITGFMMENNSPECIAKHITMALDHTNLEDIGNNGHKWVTSNYTFDNVVEQWRSLMRV